MRAPDFSGMIEADRATEAERLREEALGKARRLQEAGDPEGRRREAEACILDFDPKQKGIYYNRLCFVNLASVDLDTRSVSRPGLFFRQPFFCLIILYDCVCTFIWFC